MTEHSLMSTYCKKCCRKHFIAHRLPKGFPPVGVYMLCVPFNEVLVNLGALVNINFI